MGDDNLLDVVDEVITHDGDSVIVMVGFLDAGLTFYGPFDDEELAEDFIQNVVSASLPAHWAWMTDPAMFGDDPAICGSCGASTCICKEKEETKVRILKKPVAKTLPAAQQLLTEGMRAG